MTQHLNRKQFDSLCNYHASVLDRLYSIELEKEVLMQQATDVEKILLENPFLLYLSSQPKESTHE